MIILTVLGGIVGVVILMAVSSIFNGYALSILWGWFMVPTFGLPKLTIPTAIGIALVVSYLTHQIDTDTKSDEKKKSFGESLVSGTIVGIMKPALALFFGWIVHMFV